MKELKGTKTEKNLLEAFAGESQARTSTLTMHQKQRKTVTSRLLLFLKRQPTTKRSTLSYGSNICIMARLLLPWRI